MSINKTASLADIITGWMRSRPTRILVAGCGHGEEAIVLGKFFDCEVVGIDIKLSRENRPESKVWLMAGDITKMNFDDEEFDFVYSFHVLEHVPAYRVALTEMRRVLKKGGGWCIGTPNRCRVVGYLGSNGVDWSTKMAWNWSDWKMRLKGRFRNEFGAHAGFAPEELTSELESVFGETRDISRLYYRKIYPRQASMVELLYMTGIGRYLFPSVYCVGYRQAD